LAHRGPGVSLQGNFVAEVFVAGGFCHRGFWIGFLDSDQWSIKNFRKGAGESHSISIIQMSC